MADAIRSQDARGAHADDPPIDEKKGADVGLHSPSLSDDADHHSTDGVVEPTEEEFATLRRVSGKIPWLALTITFVEFCERFSWYGTTQVFTNFIQQPRPNYTGTGSITSSPECYARYGEKACQQPGALNQGQRASTGLTTFSQFWAYIMPLFGAWIADEYLGRYRTIQWSILFAMLGHVLLIVSALPTVIDDAQGALGCFSLALVVLGIGTGGFKSNISALVAEQIKDKRARVLTLSTGERVIMDPFITISRVYHYFYLCVNVGSLLGGIAMPYAERYVGFWLAYLLPTCLFIFAPVVLFALRNRYVQQRPSHSVVARSVKLLKLASRGCWSFNPVKMYRNFSSPDFWEKVKPSNCPNGPAWMREIDDAWVDQVRRGYAACKVFLALPLYWLCYNEMSNNLVSQAATMRLGGVPNDIINNLDPLALIILIPIFDKTLYPFLRKLRINFTPIKRITLGFFIASSAMVSAAVTQYYIYHLGPCGWYASDCTDPAPISVWVQTVPFVLIAISEIFASITSLEYAFSKAPENMRSIVQAVALAQTAFAAAIGQAFTPLSEDPVVIWNYTVVAVLAFIGGVVFWWCWRDLDKEEDKLNHLKETAYKGRQRSIIGDEEVLQEFAKAQAEAVQPLGNK